MLLLFAESNVKNIFEFIEPLVFSFWRVDLKKRSVLLFSLLNYLLKFNLWNRDRKNRRILLSLRLWVRLYLWCLFNDSLLRLSYFFV